MERLLLNRSSLFLDNQFNCHALIPAEPSYLIYAQFLSQLHLPSLKWQFEKGGTGQLEEEDVDGLVILDSVLINSLEAAKTVQPIQLFTYFLLQNYLGRSNYFNGVGMRYSLKNHFLFLPNSFDTKMVENAEFFLDDLAKFCLKNFKKNELKQAAEVFFVLMDQKLEPKIQLVLTQFVSETGITIDKNQFVNDAVNYQRLDRLEDFVAQLIQRL